MCYANDYQREAHKFASYGGNSMYPILGLAEEAGEVCGKVAKFIRKNNGFIPIDADFERILAKGILTEEETKVNHKFREDLSKELGDVLWMVAEVATVFGMNLCDIMEENIAKLEDRKKRGVIVGEGDNR